MYTLEIGDYDFPDSSEGQVLSEMRLDCLNDANELELHWIETSDLRYTVPHSYWNWNYTVRTPLRPCQ